MTGETPDQRKPAAPIPLEARVSARGDDPQPVDAKRLYDASAVDDSSADPEDPAELFLRRCIKSVETELAGRRPAGTAPVVSAADTAFLAFVSSYIAAHQDPRHLVKALQDVLGDAGAHISEAERVHD